MKKKVNVLDIFTGLAGLTNHERRGERYTRAFEFMVTKADSAVLNEGDTIIRNIDPALLQTPELPHLPADLRGSLTGHAALHSEVEQRAKADMAGLADMVDTDTDVAAIGKTIMSDTDQQELEHGDFFRYLRDAPDDLELAQSMGVEVAPHGGQVAVSAAVDRAIPQQTVPPSAYPAGPSQGDYTLVG